MYYLPNGDNKVKVVKDVFDGQANDTYIIYVNLIILDGKDEKVNASDFKIVILEVPDYVDTYYKKMKDV